MSFSRLVDGRRWCNGSVVFALAALAGLVVIVLIRFDAFALTRDVRLGDRVWSVPATFATVDHPFHATRGALLLDALRDGTWPRWIGNHQGGYPAEFYPFGLPWLDVGVWALAAGSIPILTAHKFAVLIVFLLPAAGFWIIARGDRLLPMTAVLATGLHLVIPGFWTNGGSEELIGWGLATNVAGAVLAFTTLGALARCVLFGERRMGLLAAPVIAAAVVTNPRSIFAIAIVGLALLVCSFEFPGQRRGWAWLRLSWIAVVATLLFAPVLIPLLRFGNLYYFQRYQGYENLRAYWESTVLAVSLPVLLLAIGGTVVAIATPAARIARVVAVTTVFYVVVTAWLSEGEVIQQLETPRLMPFQRLLLIALAAFFVAHVLKAVASRIGGPGKTAAVNAGLAAATVFVVMLLWGSVWSPPQDFTTTAPSSTTVAEFATFREAVTLADATAPDGTAILVVGNENDRQSWWHQQLWAPNFTDHPLFYDDWLWYWHRDHDGPKMPTGEHFYPDPARAISVEYLAQHGIGAVVVTSMPVGGNAVDPREAAAVNPDLQRAETIGAWDVYEVSDATRIIDRERGTTTSIAIDDTSLRASIDGGEGDVIVRRNWFPRWEATVNGQPVDVERTVDGYMRIPVTGEGRVVVELTYGTTALDWIARLLAVCGVGGVLATPIVLRRVDHEPGEETVPSAKRSPGAETVQR